MTLNLKPTKELVQRSDRVKVNSKNELKFFFINIYTYYSPFVTSPFLLFIYYSFISSQSVDMHPIEPWCLCGLYSGKAVIYNYATQSQIKSFDVSELPVR